jgi:Zn-dependent M16 (insulinase) family peptidase
VFILVSPGYSINDVAHILEHVCLMGSRAYPSRNALNQMITRLCASTNAYTNVSETVYELSTAGWEQFAQLLPAYLDHLIAPTLTDAAFYTEVHHVNHKGEDAG